MKMELLKILLFFMTFCHAYAASNIDMDKVQCLPRQVHLSFGGSLTEMVVMWSTEVLCTPQVYYGEGEWNLSIIATGRSLPMVYKESLGQTVHKSSYLHRAYLTNLKPGTTYHYMPVSNDVSRGPFYFKTPPLAQYMKPEFLIYGDLGVHSESLAKLELEAMKGKYTSILHVGDFGYNLEDMITEGLYSGENVGDVFMAQIEEMASHIPYMVSPGNHEIEEDTFNQYRYRFSMPNTEWPIPLNKMWYSMNIGPVHFLSYSSEVFFTSNGRYIESQKQWILADLAAANRNRQTTPWIIAFGHRPMYCSNDDLDDCTLQESQVRLGLEEIFYNNGVDIVLQAHEHSYERLWPVYKGVVLAENYTDPQAPVQLITGAAGSKHGVDLMSARNESWSAFRMDNKSFNSYGRLKIFNATHLYWEQVAVLNGEVLDSVWITQEHHGPFSHATLPEDKKNKITEQKQKDTIVQNNMPKPETTGDTLTKKVTEAIKGADTKVIVGVSFAVFVVIFLLIVCIIRQCTKKRTKSYRRWETLDYGKKFYSNLKSDDKDADDFEVDVTDGTTKLIDSSKD
ncbi:acid phosphatase type 7-like isoform X2 [Ruditapes philippinarum]|uniref:acid phosphatase type 7-like isoform X2 n=1 Tax=Ruditapes philippinarum TaxID=129788 RepID=UPI00295BE013|nr:acid phosphatase type 7-like isoform X2 [Ruditapes philippinarum]